MGHKCWKSGLRPPNSPRDEGLNLDDAQRKQLNTSTEKSRRDLLECVWRTYKNVLLLGKDKITWRALFCAELGK